MDQTGMSALRCILIFFRVLLAYFFYIFEVTARYAQV